MLKAVDLTKPMWSAEERAFGLANGSTPRTLFMVVEWLELSRVEVYNKCIRPGFKTVDLTNLNPDAIEAMFNEAPDEGHFAGPTPINRPSGEPMRVRGVRVQGIAQGFQQAAAALLQPRSRRRPSTPPVGCSRWTWARSFDLAGKKTVLNLTGQPLSGSFRGKALF